jgi:Tol biopolymer transport system component
MPAEQPAPRVRERIFLGLALLALIGAGAAWVARPGGAAPRERSTAVLSIPRPSDAAFAYFDQAALSTDGKQIAFVGYLDEGKTQIYVRALDAPLVTAVPGTEGADSPFWSPDGRSLGFFSEGKLQRVDLSGGMPRVLCAVPDAWGATWGRGDVIVYGASGQGPLMRISATGGESVALTRLGPKEEAHRWPLFLADGRHVLFLGDALDAQDHHLRIVDLETGNSREVCQALSNGAVSAAGELHFVRGGKLIVQPLDLERFELRGEPRVIAENLVLIGDNHRFEFTVSGNGVLAYRSSSSLRQLRWYDRAGKLLAPVGVPQPYRDFDISPDGSKVVFGLRDADDRDSDLWILDLEHDQTSRFTFDHLGNSVPIWSPSGRSVAYMSSRKEVPSICVRGLEDSSAVQAITCANWTSLTSWFPDERRLLADGGGDLLTADLQTGSMEPLLKTQFRESEARVSPDGTLVAYVSNESGHPEVYLRSLPIGSGRERVSASAAFGPNWSHDGKELYFRDFRGETLFAAAIDAAHEPHAAPARALFRVPGMHGYASAPDGQRFLLEMESVNMLDVPLSVRIEFEAPRKP